MLLTGVIARDLFFSIWKEICCFYEEKPSFIYSVTLEMCLSEYLFKSKIGREYASYVLNHQ